MYLAIKTPVHSLRREGEIGSLEVGKDADIALINIKTEAFTPLNNIYNHLVYCEDGSDVETVISAGNILMENRKLLNVDEDAMIEELQAMTGEFQERFVKTVKENDKLMPGVDKIYWRCIEECKDHTCNLFV